MKKSSKSKSSAKSVTKSKSAAAKVVTVSKSVAIAPVVDQAKTRSMAAYKAHMTRQANALKAAKKPEDKSAAQTAMARINKNMTAFLAN